MFNNINYNFVELFSFWYTNSSYTKKINNITSIDIINLWEKIWFAKEEQQKIIDNKLKQFEYMLFEYINFESDNLFDNIILIVLYDQIPRNIYRGTQKAYIYDIIAKKYINKVLPYFDTLELIFKLTIIISLVHYENINEQILSLKLAQTIKNNNKCSEIIWISIKKIIENHKERIELFGRFPERNKYLNRKNTEKENTWLKSIYI